MGKFKSNLRSLRLQSWEVHINTERKNKSIRGIMRVSIDKEILEKIVNYIATKPYNEVQALIAMVQGDVKIIEEVDIK